MTEKTLSPVVDWRTLGQDLFDAERYDRALIVFEKALQEKPECSDIWVLHAASLSYLNRDAAALQSLNNALKYCSSLIEAEIQYDRATIFLFRAALLQNIGQYKKAYRNFALALHPERENFPSVWEKLVKAWRRNLRSISYQLFQPKLSQRIGERLQAAGLLDTAQIESILTYQLQRPQLRFGEIAVLWGWLTPKTFDFFVEQFSATPLAPSQHRLGEFLQAAALLDETQIATILEIQRSRRHLRFGEIAVHQGWLEPITLHFFLQYCR